MKINKKIIVLIMALILCGCNESGAEPVEENTQKSLPFLVVDLDGDGIELISLEESNVFFDVDGDGFAERTQWVHPDDGFIFLMTAAEAKSPKSYSQRLIGNFTNGIKKLEDNDVDKNGVFDRDDYVNTSKHIASDLGVNFVKDASTNGFSIESRSNNVWCKEFNYISVEDKTVSCGNQVYKFAELNFMYEDSNVKWRALCNILNSPKNIRKTNLERKKFCADSEN